jgi:hypothetical protein
MDHKTLLDLYNDENEDEMVLVDEEKCDEDEILSIDDEDESADFDKRSDVSQPPIQRLDMADFEIVRQSFSKERPIFDEDREDDAEDEFEFLNLDAESDAFYNNKNEGVTN